MPDNILSPRPRRLLHLDLLRIIAIFFVIFNHTGDRGYFLFAGSTESVMYFPYMATSVLCKTAVPIFFMISGSLLLPKQESYKELFSKRILRMVVILVLISVPYYVWLHGSQGLDLPNFFSYIYCNSASTSLWYLYSYIALLLMMPFLRNMVKGMKEKDFLYLIIGYALVSGVIPCLEFCLWKTDMPLHKSFDPVLFMAPSIFYALVGYYLEHVLDLGKISRKCLLLGAVLCFVTLGITCFFTHCQAQMLGDCDMEQLERFFNCFICFPAMMLYVIMKQACNRVRNERIQKLLPIFGDAVFGIYLIEKFARALTGAVYTVVQPILGSFAASIFWVFASFSLSFLIIFILKRTPIIKKIVNRFI
jgi:surface polysaccharide O-acyltransferase-like enzyme